jgi:hypothetical protein
MSPVFSNSVGQAEQSNAGKGKGQNKNLAYFSMADRVPIQPVQVALRVDLILLLLQGTVNQFLKVMAVHCLNR